MSHLLRGRAATINVLFTDDEGATVDPDAVTLTITRLDGTAVVTDAATTGSGAAARSYVLSPTVTADLDTLTATWTSLALGVETTTHEIVGAFLFTVAEAKSFDDGELGKSSSGISTADIAEERSRIAEEFEQICEVAFVPRYRVDVLDVSRPWSCLLPNMMVQRVRSLDAWDGTAWVAYDADELADLMLNPVGEVFRRTLGYFPVGCRTVRVGYEYGYQQVPPTIRRAALLTARYTLPRAKWASARAISISDPTGVSTQLWTPGYSGRGGAIHELPEVDKTLRQYMQRVPRVG